MKEANPELDRWGITNIIDKIYGCLSEADMQVLADEDKMELTSLRFFCYGRIKLSHLYPYVILDTNVKLSGEANVITEPEQDIEDQQVPTTTHVASSQDPVPSAAVINKGASGPVHINGGAKQSGGRAHSYCHICDKNYWSSNKLKLHMKIHAEERPFVCEFCGKGFASTSYQGQKTHDLIKHIMEYHPEYMELGHRN